MNRPTKIQVCPGGHEALLDELLNLRQIASLSDELRQPATAKEVLDRLAGLSDRIVLCGRKCHGCECAPTIVL